jgi:hypothetical protein
MTGQQWCSHAARHEILRAAFPRGERFAFTQLEGEQLLAPAGEDSDDAEHRDADYPCGTADAEGKGVEVDEQDVEIGKRTRSPHLYTVLECGDHPGDRALRERCGPEERVQGATNPSRVPARQYVATIASFTSGSRGW